MSPLNPLAATIVPPCATSSTFGTALASACSTATFIDICRAHVARSPLVALDEQALDALIPVVAATKPASWEWYLTSPDLSIDDVALQFALNAALNGGYFTESADGAIIQWQERGSGSMALQAWLGALAADRLLPGRDLHTVDEVRAALAPRVVGLPFAAERLAICEEFAAPHRQASLRALVRCARAAGDNAGVDFLVALEHADVLAALFPAGFGGDPFRKKAILALMMLAGFLDARGERVVYALPVPSDYQIPRILAWRGAVRVAPEAASVLTRDDGLLDVESDVVVALRAAAVVGARALAERAGTSDMLVDNALFLGFRKNLDFQRGALPPMRARSLWF